MKRAIFQFLLVFTLFPLNSFSQLGFNIVQDLGFPSNHFRDMIVEKDTIIGYGVGFNDTFEWKQGVLIAKVDSMGALINSVIILDSLGDKLAIDKAWGKIIKTQDGGYAMTAASLIRNSAMLIKVNHALQVEFIKEYEDTVNLSNYFYKIVEISNGYLLHGAIQRPNYNNDGFVRRVDNIGNTIWFKYFGNYNFEDGLLDLKMINDSTFIAGSIEATSPDIYGSYRNIFRLIDLDGNVLQTWQSEPDPESGYFRKILLTEDGGFLTYGEYFGYRFQYKAGSIYYG